jgi:hypothetical protein
VTPLILLDGWDEIAPDRKPVAERWIESLVGRLPDAHIVLTSRPEGISSAAFERSGFRWVTVLPLRPDESAELARRWFEGLTKQLYSSPDITLDDVEKAKRELLGELSSPIIADMADSPLLTSMICCLYATGHGSAPDKRGRLYELVLAALLDARERERGSMTLFWKSLDIEKKLKMLGAVARVMSELGVSSLPITRRVGNSNPSIFDIVADVLPVLGRSRNDAAAWTDALLSRSVVLQRVSRSEAEFAHRSIQDFLAAKAFRDDGDLLEVLYRAERGQLALLPFACYQANLETTDSVIAWLMRQVEDSQSSGERLREFLFCLVECLGSATAISPSLRAQAETALGSIFPPHELSEAKFLATLGNAAVPYLARSRVVDPLLRRLSIEALSRIGTSEALDELVNYARFADTRDADALADGIGRFDPDMYSRSVLGQIPCDLNMTVTDESVLNATARLGAITTLQLYGIKFSDFGLAKVANLHRLQQIHIKRCRNLGRLDWTMSVDTLRNISVEDSGSLNDVEGLGPSKLWALTLKELDIDPPVLKGILSRLPNLRVLSLANLRYRLGRKLAWPEVLPKLESAIFANQTKLNTFVHLGSDRIDSLKFLGNCQKLTSLSIGYALTAQDLKDVARCTKLRNLDIALLGNISDASELSELQELTRLSIRGATPLILRSLEGLEKLEFLSIIDSDLGYASRFKAPQSVRVLRFTGCTFRGDYSWDASGEGADSSVQELIWRAGSLTSLVFLLKMPELRKVDVEDDGSIRSFDGLEALPDGCRLRLTGTRWGLGEEPIRELARRCVVDYEPDYDSDTFTSGFWVDYGGS